MLAAFFKFCYQGRNFAYRIFAGSFKPEDNLFVLHSGEYSNGGIKTSRTEYQLAKLVN